MCADTAALVVRNLYMWRIMLADSYEQCLIGTEHVLADVCVVKDVNARVIPYTTIISHQVQYIA